MANALTQSHVMRSGVVRRFPVLARRKKKAAAEMLCLEGHHGLQKVVNVKFTHFTGAAVVVSVIAPSSTAESYTRITVGVQLSHTSHRHRSHL